MQTILPESGIILEIFSSTILDLTTTFRNSGLIIIVRYQGLARTPAYSESYMLRIESVKKAVAYSVFLK